MLKYSCILQVKRAKENFQKKVTKISYQSNIRVDEVWIYHRKIGHKSTNASWIGQGQSSTSIRSWSKFQAKSLFSIFFESNGSVLIHGVDEGKTIEYSLYIEN